ncbi:hypothetical protein QBC46DRAFT_34660 [Diplogelasinospora grovesii]|uniref:BHLH domain-containing protein n=1 Tax=Diplogelasinospora grovesii TaxID=303347 RepID=A0AAN6NE91_9PEZI|nr:hypothetical protein QBC46DRAFT_34660 [Diplogelasinospora grovesii]
MLRSTDETRLSCTSRRYIYLTCQKALAYETMGSGQPPNGNSLLPFGYSIDSAGEQLFFDAPPDIRPSGEPLLTNSDTKRLEGFFGGLQNGDCGSGFFGSFDFNQDLGSIPPDLLGHSTSLHQNATPSFFSQNAYQEGATFAHSHIMPYLPQQLLPPNSHLTDQPLSEDVIRAAAVLQNGSMGRAMGTNQQQFYVLPQNLPEIHSQPAPQMRHQSLAAFREDERRNSLASASQHDNQFSEMAFGSTSRHASLSRPAPPMEVQWGSDANFSQPTYVPPSERETLEHMENERMTYMQCLEPSTSAATTQPSSPVLNAGSSPLKLRTRVSNPQPQEEDEDAPSGPPPKRRKSKAAAIKQENGGDLEVLKHKARGGRPRGKTELSVSVSPPGSGEMRPPPAPGKRRKSTPSSNAVKKARENLTEEEKRENHIKSEQKRRVLIKEGYDNLTELVPGLKDGQQSKSEVLRMAHDFLDALVKSNAKFETQSKGVSM